MSKLFKLVEDFIKKEKPQEAFYVINVDDIIAKFQNWVIKMPRVKPFFAVKSNDTPLIIELLAILGTGFDCASKGEIEIVLNKGIAPEKIIYANPCKSLSYIDYAKQCDINLTTFDNETELFKMAAIHPKCNLVLRIETDNSYSKYHLNQKYGAKLENVYYLMNLAIQLKLNIIGVSFHVGSDCFNPVVFSSAIEKSRKVFEIGKSLGIKMSLLDIGGGFPGSMAQNSFQLFDLFSVVINQSLNLWFPEKDKVEIIAEPGRYFVASACTLFSMIIGKKIGFNQSGEKCTMYYINEGIYGSFSPTTFDQDEVCPFLFFEAVDDSNKPKSISMIWGQTCDSLDCIRRNILLPNLNINQWLIFKDMGAYTMPIFTRFNGFKPPAIKVYLSVKAIIFLKTFLKKKIKNKR